MEYGEFDAHERHGVCGTPSPCGGGDEVEDRAHFDQRPLMAIVERVAALVDLHQDEPVAEELAGLVEELRAEAEAEDVLSEAEELRLKLEALRAADYRDQQRSACTESPGCSARIFRLDDEIRSFTTPVKEDEPRSAAVLPPLVSPPPARFAVEDMYEFPAADKKARDPRELGGGASEGVTKKASSDGDRKADACNAGDGFTKRASSDGVRGGDACNAADGAAGPPPSERPSSVSTTAAQDATNSHRLRLIEKRFKEREKGFLEDLKARDQKLNAASRALHRAKAQNNQLTAQVSLKDLQITRLDAQVSQLRTLLVEKERRLQTTLDAEAAALSACRAAEKHASECAAAAEAARASASFRSVEAVESATIEGLAAESGQLAGLPNSGCAATPTPEAPQPAIEVVRALTRDARGPETALEKVPEASTSLQLQHLARVTEDLAEALDAQREELSATMELLRAEQALRASLQQDQEATRKELEEKDALMIPLKQAADKLRVLEERTRRVELEDRIQKALAKRGGRHREYHPHLEI
eukprot:TRINITY_DN9387_c0_g1_i3.p1 TRINITY_DN9387_c0_g1~~TRINITY_DN9387_c0_g1_i3.p1  ORF type:complete len:578 (+),score=155.70 TRINITY_DN9387_c0_g1_i3:141-1736(+)